MRQYIALIHKDPGSDYGVSFPDLPGCVTAGVDLDDARVMAEEALALHLKGMADDEEPIPEPSSVEAVMADRLNRDAVAILVSAPPTTAKAVRVNMTMPEDELERIDDFAAKQGYTRSGFLLHAAKRTMDEAEAAKSDAARVRAYSERAIEALLTDAPGEATRTQVTLTRLAGVAKPTSEDPVGNAMRAIEAAMVKVDAAQKAFEVGPAGKELLKAIEAVLRNEAKAGEARPTAKKAKSAPAR